MLDWLAKIKDMGENTFHSVAKRLRQGFHKDDLHEFKPALVEIEERPASPLGRVVFWTVVATMAFFAAWMYLGKIDVVVSCRGIVIPEGDVKVLQPLETGVVSAMMCKEGDFVNKGQVLMEVDPSLTDPELGSRQKNLHYLELEKMRLNATLNGVAFSPDNKSCDGESVKTQHELHRSSVMSLQKQLDAKRAELGHVAEEQFAAKKDQRYHASLLEMAQDRERRTKVVAHIVSKNEYAKAIQDVLTYSNNVEQLNHKIEQLHHRSRQITAEMAYIKEHSRTATLSELADRQKTSTEIQAEIDKTTFRKQQQKILSPVDGYVSNLNFHTIGGIVTPAQPLITVVPVGTPLVIKASVLNHDIGFIRDGMDVSVKIDTFEFQKYGILKGIVRSISRHSSEHKELGLIYEVFITPLETTLTVKGKRMPITSGMSLTAEIKVEKRRVIEFFIYPLIKYLDEGMSVR
jgi:hemolysin D